MSDEHDPDQAFAEWLAQRPWAQALAGVATVILGAGLLLGEGIPGWVRWGLGPLCVVGGLFSVAVPLLRRGP